MPIYESIAMMSFPLHMGVKEDFDLVFRTYYQSLIHYAQRFVDEEDANDVVENLFVKLWQKNPELSSEAHLRNYLYLSIRNGCLNYQKTKQNEAFRYQQVMEKTPLTEASHLEQLIHGEVLAEIYRAIHNLPLQCAKVISASFIEGKTNGEIAAELELSEQTVKNHKVRGLKMLKTVLSKETFTLFLLLRFLS